MDSELNTDVGFFGASLVGYPNVKQFGTYNEKISIDNESPVFDYKQTATDDLSHIWATNNRDNIDDLNKVLRDANVNALDVDFYGATDLNVVEPTNDFSKLLSGTQLVINDEMHTPEEVDEVYNPDNYPNKKYPLDTYSEGLTTKVSVHRKGASLWLLLLVFVVVIFLGMHGYRFIQKNNNNNR
jgi:hypothetical protein